MVWPVMPLAASMHRKALSWAISSSFTRRCSGALAWAVAQAKARHVVRVQVGDRVWTRGPGDSALTWHTADEPIPSSQVRVTLHQG